MRDIKKMLDEYDRKYQTTGPITNKGIIYYSDLEQLDELSEPGRIDGIANGFKAGYIAGYRRAKREAREKARAVKK